MAGLWSTVENISSIAGGRTSIESGAPWEVGQPALLVVAYSHRVRTVIIDGPHPIQNGRLWVRTISFNTRSVQPETLIFPLDMSNPVDIDFFLTGDNI